MVVEPIGSVMNYQAQVQTQPTNKTQEMPDAPKSQITAPQVDNKVIVVEQSEKNSKEGAEDGDKESRSNSNEDLIQQAMKELNRKSTSVIAEFGVHEATNRITIKMVDKKTKEVVKELPPEKMLDMIARVWEYAGLFVDESR